jgi:hypothetical protein
MSLPIQIPINQSLQDWIAKSNATLQKRNIRPWRTYELQASWDGAVFAAFPHPFGWGWSLQDALSHCLTNEYKDNNFSPEFKNWLGPERTEQLMKILSEQQNEQSNNSSII